MKFNSGFDKTRMQEVKQTEIHRRAFDIANKLYYHANEFQEIQTAKIC